MPQSSRLEEERDGRNEGTEGESTAERRARTGAVVARARAGAGGGASRVGAVELCGELLEGGKVAGRVVDSVDGEDHAGTAVGGAVGLVLAAVEPERGGVVDGDVPDGEVGRVRVNGHAVGW